MTPELHDKLRLEMIIESPSLRRAEDILTKAGATGWTAIPAVSGSNGVRKWSRGTDISSSTDMVVLICVGDDDILMPALKQLNEFLDRRIGVLNISTVQVLRDALF